MTEDTLTAVFPKHQSFPAATITYERYDLTKPLSLAMKNQNQTSTIQSK